MIATAEELHQLRRGAVEHRVVFEVVPEFSVATGARTKIGYDIILSGTHRPSDAPSRPAPGCERCVAVYDRLRELALASLPREDRDSTCALSDFQPSLRYAAKRQTGSRARADVELVISIRHRDEYNRDVDPCEERCLHEVVAALRSLGVQEGTWSKYASECDARGHT
jgi:hypothetical protein